MRIQPEEYYSVEPTLEFAPITDRAEVGGTRLNTRDLNVLVVENSLFDLLLSATAKASSSGETTLAANLLNLLVAFTYTTAQAAPRTKQPGNLGMVIALSRLIGFKQCHVRTILESLLRASLIVPHGDAQTLYGGSSSVSE